MTEFIRLWEIQLDIAWDVRNDFTFMSEEGPHLSLLPDEFLPSLDKHLFQLKIAIEKVQQLLKYSSFQSTFLA